MLIGLVLDFGAVGGDVADGIGRIPTMTTDTTSGVTMSASSVFGAGNEAWRAGDKLYGTNAGANNWLSASGVNATLSVDLGAAYTIFTYDCQNTTGYQSGCTTGWTFHGANASDYSDEVLLDTRASVSWGGTGTSADVQTFTIASPGSYRYYRWKTTARGGSFSGFGEVQLYS